MREPKSMYIKESGSGMQDILRALQFLSQSQVLVGIPEGAGADHGGMSNVALAFLHTNGSPVSKIPPRPFLEPAIEEAKEDIAERMMEAARDAFAGDLAAAAEQMDMAGFIGENAAKGYLGSGHHAANAPITVHGGWMRNRVSGKPVCVRGKGSSTPLLDTGSLRNSITHIVETKG